MEAAATERACQRRRVLGLEGAEVRRVLIQGCGLIGTSIALALRDQATVLLADSDAHHLATAVARGAGEPWDGRSRVDLLVVATPPRFVASLLKAAQSLGVAQTYTHVSSVQSQVQHEVESLGCDLPSVVGGHPMAGREITGPGAAASDLFVGRPWAICAARTSSRQAVSDVRWLAEACGGSHVEISADDHDRAVALLSHLPQVAASALAALLAAHPVAPRTGQMDLAEGFAEGLAEGGAAPAGDGAPDSTPTAPELTAVLSGPGLADTTRLAASDARLWTDILTSNAQHVAPAIEDLVAVLSALARALEAHAAADGDEVQRTASEREVRQLLERGRQGRALVPVKRGEVSEAFDRVGVSVDDKPGRLAALLVAAGSAGINVEDVHVEHIPGRPQGVIQLLVDRSVASALRASLVEQGWAVLGA